MNTKDTSSFLKKPVLSALVFFGTSIVLSVVYATYQTINSSEYAAGSPVTSSLMGKIAGNIDNLNTRLTSAEATITSQTATIVSMNTTISTLSPSWAVMAFNLATCPTGWSPADGGGGRPDLRGEFIRGLDNGRGVDGGRALKSFQRGSIISYDQAGFNRISGLSSQVGVSEGSQAYWDLFGVDNPTLPWAANTSINRMLGANIYSDSSYIGSSGISRPRNVALLYCVKN